MSIVETSSNSHIVMVERGQVSPTPRVHYLVHDFDVPTGVSRLTVRLRYRKERLCQLFMALFDPERYRGTRMNPGGYGQIELELMLGEREAGPGALAGPLPPGRWRAMIDIERTAETADYEIEAIAEFGMVGDVASAAVAADEVVSVAEPEGEGVPDAARTGRNAGWYRGELHAHSWHSDGKMPVEAVVEAARAYGLDFLALTDHFTNAGWSDLRGRGGPDLLLMRGLEITAHSGHANLHGAGAWINPYVDGPALTPSGESVEVGPGGVPWDINAAASATRDRGGLFCVNHPFAGDLGWRYHQFDWGLADLMEIYHHLEGPHNALALGLWDEQLRAGRRLIGVAGIDSHHPREGRHRLGQCFTYVHTPELSEAGIIEGLRSGRAYVSLGPQLEFWAEGADGMRTEMGGRTPTPGPLRLRVELRDLRYPGRLYVLKNGFYHETFAVEPGRDVVTIEVEDVPTSPGYYRLELYLAHPQEQTRSFRQTDSLLVLSNPIWT